MHVFDLNLVRVFLAVWETRSLTVAGNRLGLTQPAVSHALQRLRDAFDDPLFVRAGKTMAPTEAATRLHEPLGRAYGLINYAVQEHRTFEAATTRRRFTIAMSDVSEAYFLPRLLAAFAASAPGAELDVLPLDTTEVATQLQRGAVDVAIGHLPGIERDCAGRPLLSDRLICLVRRGHPIIGREAELPSFMALRHIHAGTSAPGHQMIDLRLAESGMARLIAVRIARLTIAPEIVRNTDLAVIFPESLARKVNAADDFALLDIPFALPMIDVKAHVHSKFEGDPGVRWLSQLIGDTFGASAASDL